MQYSAKLTHTKKNETNHDTKKKVSFTHFTQQLFFIQLFVLPKILHQHKSILHTSTQKHTHGMSVFSSNLNEGHSLQKKI